MIKQEENTTKLDQFIPKEKYDLLLADHLELKRQLGELKRMIFGVKSERFVPQECPSQLSLFNSPLDEDPVTAETEQLTFERKKVSKKKKAIRLHISSHLLRKEEIIEPGNIEKGAVKIGEEITEILEYTPSQLYVRRIVRPKYSKAESGIIIAELPSLPIPKGNAGPSLLAHICVSKYIDHLPFYRQIQILKRQKIVISSSTFNGWFSATTRLLEPLYDTLVKATLDCDYIQADESPIGVQDSNKDGSLHQGYQWVYRNPVDGLVLFKYNPSRKKEVPKDMLDNFRGALQTDGYKGYCCLQAREDILALACMAHARRYFEKALDSDQKKATYVLSQIQLLYEIEREAKKQDLDHLQRKELRQIKALPILNKIADWLEINQQKALPKSAIRKAIDYTINLWSMLTAYTLDGRYEIDNNNIENKIRPLALGRKNYLFAGSHEAAQRAAMMYSFFATCKDNDVNPLEWLTDVLARIQEHKANKLHELLPQNWKCTIREKHS